MSNYQSIESTILLKAEVVLDIATMPFGTSKYEAQLQILESCAAKIGGFSLAKFFKVFGITPLFDENLLKICTTSVLEEINKTPIHPALALSALARESLKEIDRKNSGAYHTDFRLAIRLAKSVSKEINYKSRVIDPACGSGILLIALTLQVCGDSPEVMSYWLEHGVFAADQSKNSLRGCLLALASLTSDIKILKIMRDRWFCGDSLLAPFSTWQKMAPNGFDTVLGNPPWEKIKLSRHEFLTSNGEKRHYGADLLKIDNQHFQVNRNKLFNYARELALKYPDLIRGEADLYIAFTELFYNLCKPAGTISVLVPGGMIRSQGTEIIRRKLINESLSISISIFDNRARFFEIDSRFKFLLISLKKSKNNFKKTKHIELLHERGTSLGTEEYGSVKINRLSLLKVREDYSIPEVRNGYEWRVFQHMAINGKNWNDLAGDWVPQFCREVDMTKERPFFNSEAGPNLLPLIEGRMVHQHRFGAKAYVSGSGRRATWKALPIGSVQVKPQFWISPNNINQAALKRTRTYRVGFCDITGQTNERSLMAAIIPPGVSCGNKVPTILFESDQSEERLFVWAAIANSFCFDWMIRRIITTTVNYFLLQSIPLPRLKKNSLPWRNLYSLAEELIHLQYAGETLLNAQRIANIRAEIDADVAIAYDLSLEDFAIIFQDFPLVDKNQPPIIGENHSTITRDMVMAKMAKRLGHSPKLWELRIQYAHEIGAVAFVPSENSMLTNFDSKAFQIESAHGRCIKSNY